MPLFSNPWIHDDHNLADVLRWKFGLSPKDEPSSAPDTPAPSVPYAAEVPPAEGWRVSWLGHSSFLLQGAGKSLLVDPVFSDHCAPLPLPAMRRLVPPPCRADQLPSIDAVLLTHSHYDHLDLPTLRLLGKEMPLFVAEGHETWLRKQGFRHVTQLPWWSAAEILPGITATATPAQHFTARTPFDRNHGHWCGWLVEGAGVKLWHAGDSGYCPAFKEIGDRFGPIDFGMIPIGAYSPRWFMGSMHMNPEDAVMAFQETRCRQAVAMHWGTFRLTDEPMGEPPLRLLAAMEKAGLDSESFTTLAVGESRAVQRF